MFLLKNIFPIITLFFLSAVCGTESTELEFMDDLSEEFLSNIPSGTGSVKNHTGCYEIDGLLVGCIDHGCVYYRPNTKGDTFPMCGGFFKTSYKSFEYLEQHGGALGHGSHYGKVEHQGALYSASFTSSSTFILGACNHQSGSQYSYIDCWRVDGNFSDEYTSVRRRRVKGTYASIPLECTAIYSETWIKTDNNKCI